MREPFYVILTMNATDRINAAANLRRIAVRLLSTVYQFHPSANQLDKEDKYEIDLLKIEIDKMKKSKDKNPERYKQLTEELKEKKRKAREKVNSLSEEEKAKKQQELNAWIKSTPIRITEDYKKDKREEVEKKYRNYKREIDLYERIACDMMRSRNLTGRIHNMSLKSYMKKGYFHLLPGVSIYGASIIIGGKGSSFGVRYYFLEYGGECYLIAFFIKKEDGLSEDERNVVNTRIQNFNKLNSAVPGGKYSKSPLI